MAEKLTVDDARAPITDGEGANGLTQESFREWMARFITDRKVLTDQRAARKEFRDGAKLAGIALGRMDATVKMLEWAPDEVREELQGILQYAMFAGLPGARALAERDDQLDLFPEQEPEVQSEADWEDRGYAACVLGKPIEAPAECPPDRIQAWQRGVNRGTAKNAEGFKPRVVS
jgi:hypothetical protein